MTPQQKITPFLWFDGQAEAAMNHYVAIFKNSRIGDVARCGEGGPAFKFTEAISLLVSCETQLEVDELWEKLSDGGHKSRCGWLKDKFGLSWQIIPKALGELLSDQDPVKSGRVMRAMLQMTKIEIDGLKRAYDGGDQ